MPIFSSAGRTESVFIFDAGTGQSALLRNARKPKKMRLEKTATNLYDWFPKGLNRPRILTAVPKVRSNGATEGIWIFDSATGDVLYFENVSGPKKIKVHRVQQKTR